MGAVSNDERHEAHDERCPRVPAVLAMLVAALVLVPSANFTVFSGLPLSTPVELVAGLLLAPLVFSTTLRRGFAERFRQVGRHGPAVVLLLAIVAVAAKALLFASGEHEGFRACYRSLETEGPARCERSYENPLFRFHATRLDRAIDFGPVDLDRDWYPYGLVVPAAIQRTDWRLSFLNARRFNFYDGDEPDVARRAWLQFAATWRGEIDHDRPRRLAITYLGEGRVRVGDRSVRLAPAYRSARTVPLAVPGGRQRVAITYRFARPLEDRDVTTEPYATLRVLEVDGRALTAAGPGSGWRVAGTAVDGLVALLLALLLAHYASVVRPLAWLLLGAAGAAALAALAPGFDPSQQAHAAVVGALFLTLVLRHDRHPLVPSLLTAYLALVVVEVTRAVANYGDLQTVLYRGGGHDFLTYEGDARRILETGSLQGGEDVFVYSSGFRYLLFLAHVLFGDRDVMIGVVGVVALTFSVFLLAWQVLTHEQPETPARPARHDRRRQARQRRPARAPASLLERLGPRRLVVIAATFALVVLVESAGVLDVRLLISEYSTWIFLLVAAWCFLGPWSPRRSVLGAALAGLALFVRANQMVAVLVLLAAGLVACLRGPADRRQRWLVAGGMVGVFAAIAALPAIHNLHYGGEFRLVAETPDLPVNFPLPLGDAVRVFSDADVRATLWHQLSGVFVTTRLAPTDVVSLATPFVLAVRAVQLLWLAALVFTVARWRQVTPLGKLVVLLPVAYLGPHVFIQVFVYYPRHVIAGHLAMGVAAAYVLGGPGQKPAPVAPGGQPRRRP